MKRVKSLAWTDDPEAAKLLAADPLALLVGFLLDQQVPMEWAFGAPYTLKQRLGGKLDAGTLATIEPEKLVQDFLAKPPLHRYPAAMAKRTQKLAQVIRADYDGDASRIWREAADAGDVSKRIAKLPGLSVGKARVIIAVLVKQLGEDIPGWEKLAPDWYSLADVRTKADLLQYREIKRAAKRAGDWPPGSGRKKPRAKPATKAAGKAKKA
ncbi:MAG: HhH-GPD-type base excision DNA repair protein [Candidatus Dormiibacterota bacterium]